MMRQSHSRKRFRPERIISGGQTGVDRGALDAAMALEIPHGGWCPKGRRAEDGVIPLEYQLSETESAEYAVRTERNVLESDATLIICRGSPSGGTALTLWLAQRHAKPHLVVDLDHLSSAKVRRWLTTSRPATLNVAGPRESTAPEIAADARDLLIQLLS
jgi:hypothetical protein